MPFGAGGLDEVGVRATVQGFGPYMAQIDRMEKKTQGFGSKIGAALKKGSLIGGAAVVAMGAISVKAFAGFDSAMTQSLAIMGDVSGPARKDMEKAARAVAKTTTFSAKQAAESYFFLASAGLDAAASVKAMPKVAKFAQAGMFDMARATDLATDAQSALGLTIRKDAVKNVKNLVRVTDVLVKANTLANATVEQFAKSLTTKAGAAMRSLGMDMEEGVAVLAAFADQGIKGQIAGEKFSIILRDLQKASIDNREAFEKMGVSVFDANGEVRNMGVIVGELERALGPMSDEQKKVTLGMLGFQEESQASLLALLGTSEAIKTYEKELRNAAGTTEEIAEKQLQTFSAQLTLLWHKIEDVFIEVGSKLVPVLMTLMTVLENDVVPAVKDVVAVFVDVVEWLISNKYWVGILAGVLVATLIPAILAWTQAAWANVTAQAAQFTAMVLARPPVLALVGVLGVLAAAYLATDKEGRKMAMGFLTTIGKMEAQALHAVLGPFGLDPVFGKLVKRLEDAGLEADEYVKKMAGAEAASVKWAEQTLSDIAAMVTEGEELGLTMEQIELAQLEKLAQELAKIGPLMTDEDIGGIWSTVMEEVMRSSNLSALEIDHLIDRAVELTGASEEGAEIIREQLTTAIADLHLPAKEAKKDLEELVDVVEEVPTPVEQAAEAFGTFKEGVDAAMEGVGEAIKKVLPTIDEEFAAWDERLAEMAAAYTNFETNLGTILDALVAAHVEQPELIIQALADAGPGVTQAMATHLAEEPVAAVDETLANLGIVVGTNVDAATDAVLQKTPAFQASIVGLALEGVEAMDKTLFDKLGPAVGVNIDHAALQIHLREKDYIGYMSELGRAAVRGFKTGWEAEGLIGWTQQQFQAVEDAARAWAQAQSPSRRFERLGQDITLGLIHGLEMKPVQEVAPKVMVSVAAPVVQVARETILAPSVAAQPAPVASGGGVDPAALAAAVASALQGMTVTMDGREVGRLINDRLGEGTFMLGRAG